MAGDRCGADHPGEVCACDPDCHVYGDCCEDIADVCLPEDGDETQKKTRGVSSSSPGPVLSQSLIKPVPEMVQCSWGRTRLVSACPNPALLTFGGPFMYRGKLITADQVVKRCGSPWDAAGDEDVLQMMPVTDSVSKHHFLNVYCLLCHGGEVANALPWALIFAWNSKSVKDWPADHPQDMHQLIQKARKLRVPTVAMPPEGVRARRCLPRDMFYRTPCECPELFHLCQFAQDAYVYGGRQLYRNRHCLLCHFLTSDFSLKGVSAPNMESVVYLRNKFEFWMLMRWDSSGDNEDTARMSVDINGEFSFAWRDMTCSMTVNGNLTLVVVDTQENEAPQTSAVTNRESSDEKLNDQADVDDNATGPSNVTDRGGSAVALL
nr:hypothetical protein BaRGS_032698 [Batillaria attramentaria]